MSAAGVPEYLAPYVRAARRHGGDFPSLLWSSPQTQSARFAAIARLADPTGRHVLDIGCGRGDLLNWYAAAGKPPAQYTGIEAVPALAAEARRKVGGQGMILEADFIAEPRKLSIGADLLVVSGSLNTCGVADFYRVLRHAWDAAGKGLVFNFLAHPSIAAADYLTWHRPEHVETFVRSLGGKWQRADDYLFGDVTFAVAKSEPAP